MEEEARTENTIDPATHKPSGGWIRSTLRILTSATGGIAGSIHKNSLDIVELKSRQLWNHLNLRSLYFVQFEAIRRARPPALFRPISAQEQKSLKRRMRRVKSALSIVTKRRHCSPFHAPRTLLASCSFLWRAGGGTFIYSFRNQRKSICYAY